MPNKDKAAIRKKGGNPGVFVLGTSWMEYSRRRSDQHLQNCWRNEINDKLEFPIGLKHLGF